MIYGTFSPILTDIHNIQGASLDQLTCAVTTLINDFVKLFDEANNPPAGLGDFWATFPADLLDNLVYTYLKLNQQQMFAILSAVGIVSEVSEQPDPLTGRGSYTRRTVNWNNIPKTVTEPSIIFSSIYNWGGAAFDYPALLGNVKKLLKGFVTIVDLLPASKTDLDLFYDKNSKYRPWMLELTGSPLQLIDRGAPVEGAKLTLSVLPIPPDQDKTAAPDGFAFFSTLVGTTKTLFQLSPNVTLTLSGGFGSSAPLRVGIHPNKVTVPPGLFPVSSLAKLSVQSPSPMTIFGDSDSTHIEISKAHASLSATGSDPNSIEYKAEAGVDDAALVIDLGESDGFLQTLLGSGSTKIPLPVNVSWSNKAGFAFNGEPRIVATIPVRRSIGGVLDVQSIYISLLPDNDPGANGVILQTTITGGLSLGPIAVTVEDIGLQVTLSIIDLSKSKPGNLGNLNLALGFKPPGGLGIEVDAGPIGGGGYLAYDENKEEYSGALDLNLEVIHVTAFGVVDTKMPDGLTGFSFILMIQTSGLRIQLGFGFTLNSIGGLAAMNRMISVDNIQAGFRDHSIDIVLSPPDPILEHAPQVISDLSNFFPAVNGRYVFGPKVTMGWGTPTLISCDMGVFLEFPMPSRIVLLGHIGVAIPDPDDAIIQFNMDILGSMDLQQQSLSVSAKIYDSYVAEMYLQGDMVLMFNWGDSPNFLFSIGGFNPRFQPPPGFPSIARLESGLKLGGFVNLSLSAYFAITPNTLQLGADFELSASLGDLSLNGRATFDALITFSPLSFIVDVSAGVSLSYDGAVFAGIGFSGTFSGPAPWKINGSATLELLFFSVTANVNAQIGSTPQNLPPKADPVADLMNALGDASSWSALLPSGTDLGVSFAKSLAQEGGPLLMYPTGTLTLREKVVPLKTTIDLYGGAAPDTANYFDIMQVEFRDSSDINSPQYSTDPTMAEVEDLFAPAQFFNMDDDTKLSAPSFESFDSGISASSSDQSAVNGVQKQVQYDTFMILSYAQELGNLPTKYPIKAIMMDAMSVLGPAAGSPARNSGATKFVAPGPQSSPISISSEKFVTVSTADMSPGPLLATGDGYFETTCSLSQYLNSNPEKAGTLQVIPLCEVPKS